MRVLFAAEPHCCTATALRSLAEVLQLDESQLAIAVVARVQTLQCLAPLVGIVPAPVREDTLRAAATAARRAAACAPQRASVHHLVVEAWSEVEPLVASGGHNALALAALPPRWLDRRRLLARPWSRLCRGRDSMSTPTKATCVRLRRAQWGGRAAKDQRPTRTSSASPRAIRREPDRRL